MKISEILLLDFDKEIENNRRTLERIPDEIDSIANWKPHDKSMAFGRLAMHCATIPLFGHYIIEARTSPSSGRAAPPPSPRSTTVRRNAALPSSTPATKP
jgi:hypothetical protein